MRWTFQIATLWLRPTHFNCKGPAVSSLHFQSWNQTCKLTISKCKWNIMSWGIFPTVPLLPLNPYFVLNVQTPALPGNALVCLSVLPYFFTSPSLLCSLQRSQRILSPPKGRCTRDNCKYLHPPPHLKTQLEINGRNNLIQQKAAAAMLAQQMQFMLPGAQLQPIVSSSSSSSPRITISLLYHCCHW